MIQYGTSVLLKDSQCLGKSYVKKRSELPGFEDTIPSFFRPPQSAKSKIRHLKRQREERIMVNNSIIFVYHNILYSVINDHSVENNIINDYTVETMIHINDD